MVDVISFYFLNVSFLFLFLKLFGIFSKKCFLSQNVNFSFWGRRGCGSFVFLKKLPLGTSNNGNFFIGIQEMTNYFSKNAIWKFDLAVLYLLFCQVKKKSF
jgi:hypothetical protein